MKKVFTILILLLIVFIPNVYGESKYYDFDFYKYNNKDMSEMTDEEWDVFYFLEDYEYIDYDCPNSYYCTYFYKDNTPLFTIVDNQEIINIKEQVPNRIEVLFNEEEKEYLYYYDLEDYDGIRFNLKEIKEYKSDEECTSVCINKITQGDMAYGTVVKSDPTFSSLNLNLDVSFTNLNDYITYEVNIVNNTDKDYEIATGEDFSTSEYIKYEYSINDDSNVIKANSSKTMYVSVRYYKVVPLDIIQNRPYTENNNVVINLTDNNGVPINTDDKQIEDSPVVDKDDTKIDVPDTYTGISVFIVFGLITLLAYLTYGNVKGKSLLLLFVIPIISIPIMVNAIEKLQIKVNTKIEISKVNVLEKRYASDNFSQERDFWVYHDEIKSIYIVNESRDFDSYSERFDVSDKKDGSIIAYLLEDWSLWIVSNGTIYANPNSYKYFSDFSELRSINGLNRLNTSLVTDMSYMFCDSNKLEELDLSNFDTRNVTNMKRMFALNYYHNSIKYLDLSSFDTSNVENMEAMFYGTGTGAVNFYIDLGDKFYTRNVTNMKDMFSNVCNVNEEFTLDLGDKFDTSNVTDMSGMFNYLGASSKVLTLDLGDKFDTSNVIDMSKMFYFVGYSSPVFNLNLGDKFDTSNVTNMKEMFYYLGNGSNGFNLDLGNRFNTSNVTNMRGMFYSSKIKVLDLGNKFNTSKVTNMSEMFYNNNKLETIKVGDSFNTNSLELSTSMFNRCPNLVGGSGTVYDSSHIDASYARIDGGSSNPGYFTSNIED